MALENSIDDALAIIGYGCWQIPFFLLAFLIQFLVPIHFMGSALLSVPLPFRCFSSLPAPLETISHFNSTSLTSEPPGLTYYNSECGTAGLNESLPALSPIKTDLASCSYVQFDQSTFPSTIVSEFNLVCERSTLRPLYQLVISLGALFGAPLGGVFSDKYGRKKVILGGTVVILIAVTLISLCPWYTAVLFFRFIVGLTLGFFVLPSYSLAQETTPPRFRSHTGMLLGLGFSVGLTVLAGEGFLVRHWRRLTVTASSPLLIIIPLACFVEESPRWLSQMGRKQETAEALKRAANRNSVAVTPQLLEIFQKIKVEYKNSDDIPAEGHGNEKSLLRLESFFSTCRSYFRYPGMRRILFVTPFVWYLQTLMYLGILLNANNFTSNDPFMYVALSGVMDFTAIIFTTPIAVRVGRRCLSIALYSISGTLLLLDIAIPADMKWLKWIFVMTAFLLCGASYQLQFLYVPELFPTVIRSRGFGLVNSMGSLGSVTAPFVTELLVQKAWWSVNVVCGLGGLIGSVLVALLPETRNLPMPETLQDVEKRLHSNKESNGPKVTGKRAIHQTEDQHNLEVLLTPQFESNNTEVPEG